MYNPSTQHESLKISDVVRRHKKKIIFCPLLAVAAAALFFLFCPRTYQSEAQLFIRVGRESVGIDPAATTGQTMQLYTADREDEVKSAQAIFKSRGVAAQVVDQLGAGVVLGRGDSGSKANVVASAIRKPIDVAVGFVRSLDPISEREAAIINVERCLSVTSERQATVIIVRYRAASPQLAQTICQAVVEIAQKEHMRVHRNEESTTFFTEQQNRLREQLDQALAALRNAKNEMGLANIEQRRATLESQYSAIELDRLTTSQQSATTDARIQDLEKQLDEIPEHLVTSTLSVPNHGADILRDRLYQLQMKSMDLMARYSESHPLVITVTDQLNEAKTVLEEQAELRNETTNAVNPIHQQLSLAMKQDRSAAAGLRSRLVELDQQKTAVLAEIRVLNEHDFTIDQLAREADLARTKYTQYARTMEEARIDTELQNARISNISVSQAATLAEKPVVPSRLMTAAGTFVLAIFGTFALVVFSELQNSPPQRVAMDEAKLRHVPTRRVRGRFASKVNGQPENAEAPTTPK